MTRKKFVKKLMALGISRNDANKYANKARRLNTPYGKDLILWRKYYLYLVEIGEPTPPNFREVLA